MPQIKLFDALRGPWFLKPKTNFNNGVIPVRVVDEDAKTLAIFPDEYPYDSPLVRSAIEKLPDALRLLEAFADVQNDTRVSVDGRYFCLWCGADLGHPAQATGEPDDMPDTPECLDPNCTGNAARALLMRLEIIADCEATLANEKNQ